MSINFNNDLVGEFAKLDSQALPFRMVGTSVPTHLKVDLDSARCYLATSRVLSALASTDDGNDHMANICSGIIDTLGINAVLAAIPDDWECSGGLGKTEGKRDLAFNYLWTQLTQNFDTSTDAFLAVAPLSNIVFEYMSRLAHHLAETGGWNVDQVSSSELIDYAKKLTSGERWWLVELLEMLDSNEDTLDGAYASNCEEDAADMAWRAWADRDRKFLSKLQSGHGYSQTLLYTLFSA